MDSEQAVAELSPEEARFNAWLSFIGAGVALTGVQLIAPSLPVMRDSLGLTDSQLALVMSVYLLPAAIASIPVGLLADRLGRRIVFGSSLLLFGILGLVLVFIDSFTMFLAVRFLQGVAFAGLLPLTMTILGDAYDGHRLIGAQGHRSVAMSVGDGVLPIVGGLLVVAGWQVPWLGQSLAIPLGLVVLWKLTDVPAVASHARRSGLDLGAFGRLFRSGSIIALEYAGFLRMFLKFTILTFLPVFLVDVRGLSAAFAGLVVGIAALAGTAIAATSGRIARLGNPTLWMVVGVAGMGLALIAMVLVPWAAGILAVSLIYGAFDGLMGVFTNSFVTAATSAEHRAGFVAATGAIRNFAKFTAPAAFAALVLAMPMAPAFMLMGGLTIASVAVIAMIKPLEGRLIDQRAGAIG